MTKGLDELAARKALLTAQADLSRMQMMLAWEDLRSIVSPSSSADRSGGSLRANRRAPRPVAMAKPAMAAGRTIWRYRAEGQAAEGPSAALPAVDAPGPWLIRLFSSDPARVYAGPEEAAVLDTPA